MIDLEQKLGKEFEKQLTEAEAHKIAIRIFPHVLRSHATAFHNTNEMIEARFRQSIIAGEPVKFIGFWGVGKKDIIDEKDEELLKSLREIQSGVSSVYKHGAYTTLILADLHAQFNGYDGENYLNAVADTAATDRINTLPLSRLYQNNGLPHPDPSRLPNGDPDVQTIWENPKYRRQCNQLIESAGRHNLREPNPEIAAYNYLQMRRQEIPILEQQFPNSVILVNGSKSMGMVTLPREMPHMYLKVGPVWFHQT